MMIDVRHSTIRLVRAPWFLRLFCALLLVAAATASAAEKENLLDNSFQRGNQTDQLFAYYMQQATGNPDLALTAIRLASSLQWQFFSDPRSAAEPLRKYLAASGQPPLARDAATALLARITTAQGQFPEADKLYLSRSPITGWFIAGPFGRYDRASFYEKLPPEKGVDLATAMPGNLASVRWRPLPAGASAQDLNPWDWISPHTGIVYLYATFNLKESQPVLLSAETNCSLSVWIDGRFAATADRLDAELPEQLLIRPAENKPLPAGWHSILCKLHAPGSDARFAMRLLDKTLNPLPAPEYLTAIPTEQKPAPELAAPIVYALDDSSFAQFQKPAAPAAEVKPGAAAASRAALTAASLQTSGMYDAALQYWEQAVKYAPNNAAYWSWRGTCERLCAFLPEPRRESISRQSHLKAIALDPACVPSLLALAEYERHNNRLARCADYLQQALRAQPGSLRALTALVKLARDNGWRNEASRWQAELDQKHPQSLIRHVLKATGAQSGGGFQQMADSLAAAFALDRGNLPLAADAARFYVSAGKLPAALEVLNSLAPSLRLLSATLQLKGQFYLHSGDAVNAAAAFAAASIACGADARNLREQGEALVYSGRIDQAKPLLKESLALSPQQHDLRRLLCDLENTDYAFWKPYQVNALAELKKFKSQKKEQAGKTIRLIDQTVLTVYPDGSYANYTHELQNILTTGGIKDAATITTFGDLLSARTIIPERNLFLEPVILPGQSEITMPALSPGAAVEYSYLQGDQASVDFGLRFPKWYLRSPDSEETFLFSQYVVRVTPGTPFVYAARNLNRKIRFERKKEADGTEVLIWTGRDMPRALHEAGTPSINETLPYVAVGSRNDWEGVNRLLLNYYAGRIKPSLAMLAKISELTQPQEKLTDRKKVEAIFNFVCREIEKTSAIFPASYIFDQRSGDRTLLLLALLRAAGIDASFAAARPNDDLAFPPLWEIPATGVFTEFLVRAKLQEGGALWLDPESRFSQPGSILENLAGGAVFLVDSENGSFSTLPPALPESYTTIDKRSVEVDNKNLHIRGQLFVPGLQALEFKEALYDAAAEDRHNFAESLFTSGLAGFELLEAKMPLNKQPGAHFLLEYRGTMPGALRAREDGGIGVLLGLTSLALLPDEDYAQRQTPYHLNRYIAQSCEYSYNLPQHARAIQVPGNLLLRTDFGYYQLSFNVQNNRVIVRRTCRFAPQRIALEDWPDYYKMARQIAEAERALILWR